MLEQEQHTVAVSSQAPRRGRRPVQGSCYKAQGAGRQDDALEEGLAHMLAHIRSPPPCPPHAPPSSPLSGE